MAPRAAPPEPPRARGKPEGGKATASASTATTAERAAAPRTRVCLISQYIASAGVLLCSTASCRWRGRRACCPLGVIPGSRSDPFEKQRPGRAGQASPGASRGLTARPSDPLRVDAVLAPCAVRALCWAGRLPNQWQKQAVTKVETPWLLLCPAESTVSLQPSRLVPGGLDPGGGRDGVRPGGWLAAHRVSTQATATPRRTGGRQRGYGPQTPMINSRHERPRPRVLPPCSEAGGTIHCRRAPSGLTEGLTVVSHPQPEVH